MYYFCIFPYYLYDKLEYGDRRSQDTDGKDAWLVIRNPGFMKLGLR